MKRNNRRSMLIGALGLLVGAAGCSDVTQPGQLAPGPRSLTTGEEPVPTGARIAVEKTAVPEWTTGQRYDWSLTKSGPDDLEIAPGTSKTITYTVSATRTAQGSNEFFGVTGQVCVTNNGPDATQGLRILDQLLYWDDAAVDWKGFGPEVSVDVSEKPVLGPFSSHCYTYRIPVDPAQLPPSKLGYRNKARIVIDNFMEGYEEFAHAQTQPFFFPTAPTGGSNAATATVVDAVTCPPGFTCSPGGATWTFTDSGSRTFQVTVTNNSVPCWKYRDVGNRVTLTAGPIVRVAAVVTTVFTGENCAPQTIVGCTPGFWKQTKHAQYWINHAPTDRIASVFIEANRYVLGGSSLLDGLGFGGGSGKVGAAQILLRAAVAALLNTEASGGNVAALVASVNTALASENRATMIALAEVLDAANNGNCNLK